MRAYRPMVIILLKPRISNAIADDTCKWGRGNGHVWKPKGLVVESGLYGMRTTSA